MEPENDFRAIPKRKISEAEKQIISLRIEKVRLAREKSMMILNKAVMLFFAFLGLGILGLLNDLLTRTQLNMLIVVGIAALIVGIIPYSMNARKEEKSIDDTLKELVG